ncbi:MAG TPA: DUF2599 domain-containing protein [Stenotrophomonas sp.]|jgi:hypothetical protein
MTHLRTTLAGLIAVAGAAHFGPAQAANGAETAKLLNLMYQDTRQDCGSTSRPAFLCSGVLLRGTTPSTAYQFYSVSPVNQARGGVSASYLRKDAKFKQLAFGYKSGFIFDSVLDNPGDHVDYKVLCAYPLDAASSDRQKNGCGDSSRTAAREDFCDQLGIRTAEKWLELYRKSGSLAHSAQCAFDVRQGKAVGTAKMFYENIRAMALLGDTSFNENNELVLAPWTIDVPRSPSILASFFTDEAGVEGARLSQIQWYIASKSTQVLPAIHMKLPQTQQQDAKFTYAEAKQAIRPVAQANQCTSYTQSAKWVKFTSARYPKGIQSLVVAPSDCGRKIPNSQIPNFVNKLVAAYYLTPEWANNPSTRQDSIDVVRRQLTCHLTLGRNLSAWSIEPARPLATQQLTNAGACNNS